MTVLTLHSIFQFTKYEMSIAGQFPKSGHILCYCILGNLRGTKFSKVGPFANNVPGWPSSYH